MALIGSADETDLNELWYKRIGHLHHGVLKFLKKSIRGAPELSTKRDDVCRGCVLGKYAKAAYQRNNNRDESVLGMIHSDICGPISTRDLSGVDYFITFIDDHSKNT